MKRTIFTIAIFALLMVSSAAFAGGIIGRHNLANDQGLVRVQSIVGNKMGVDIIYARAKGKVIILTGVYADFDSQKQEAVYSEDRSCPDALKMKFLNNGKVVLHEAACAVF
jgi:hypothetical protein